MEVYTVLSCNKRELDLDAIINAINGVTWYNGLAEEIVEWKNPEYLKPNKYGNIYLR